MYNVDVITGCQYGSESKGLASYMIAKERQYDVLVSVNSAQAGHTVYHEGVKHVLRHLPSSCIANQDAVIYIGSGAIINPHILEAEIRVLEDVYKIPIRNRLYISKTAGIVLQKDIDMEKERKLNESIGSTCEGIGESLSNRVKRCGPVVGQADVVDMFNTLVCDPDSQIVCPWEFHEGLMKTPNKWSEYISTQVFLEGSQGFGLSVFSPHYPFCTSRDTTTSAFLSYAGFNPTRLRNVYGVFRTYPIRVGGNSGGMKGELQWADIESRAGFMPDSIAEYTTVTKRMRRVGEWDEKLARYAMDINGVTHPILTFVNYLDSYVYRENHLSKFSPELIDKIQSMAVDIGKDWYAISTSEDERGWIKMSDQLI